MTLEIEKKFIIGSFDEVFKKLKNDFGKYTYYDKCGFWWCCNYDGIDNILNVSQTKVPKNEVAMLKEIGEFSLPVMDYQFVRLRIINNNSYFVTFKNKSLVNRKEQNIEYEFEVDKEIFKRISLNLKDTSFIFHYNIKKSWEFKLRDVKIEISKFNDLKDPYIELETVGNNEAILNKKLDDVLKLVSDYGLKEETRTYAELSKYDNKDYYKTIKLSQHSRNGYKILQDYLK